MSDPRSHAPVVLVHGIFGFDQLTLGPVGAADYFRLIPGALRAAGRVVPKPPKLNAAGSIAERAQDLKRYLEDETNADVFGRPVHLVAHSMGGLDARYMISKLGTANRVLSLTTIGTPHHGSPIADLVLAAADPALNLIAESLGMNIRGIRDLTTDACRRFNVEVPDSPEVRYFSVAGRFKPPRILGKPLGILGLSHDIIQDKEGDNDGLVSVKSATFGQSREIWSFLGTWEGNHFRLINWGTNMIPSPSELAEEIIVRKYEELAARIERIEGFH
jgi:triacylglycerol lipase